MDYNAVLPADIIRGAGFLCINGDVPFTATDGGWQFDPGADLVNRDFDGKTAHVEGQDYFDFWDPKMTATIFAINPAKTRQFMPGAATATNGGIETITPKAAATELTGTTDYLQDVRLIWPRVSGGYVWVKFKRALFTKWQPKGVAKGDAKIDVEISARLDDGEALGTCPFVVEYANSFTAPEE